MPSVCGKLIKRASGAVITLLILTPLVVVPFFPNTSLIPQAAYVRAVIEVLVVLYAILCLINPSVRPRITPIFLALTLFFLVLIVATFLGINPGRSFWGYRIRAEGLLTYLHFFALFIILRNIMQSQNEWRWIIRGLVLTSIPLGLFGLLQKFGFSVIISADCNAVYCVRINSLFHNAAFYGSYLTLVILLSFFLVAVENQIAWRWLFRVLALGNVVLLAMAGTHAAWIAVGLVMVISMTRAWLRMSPNEARLKRLAVLLSVLVLSTIVLGITMVREAGYLERNIFIDRWDSFFDKMLRITTTAQDDRLFIVKLGWQAWQQRPLLGWGPESFAYLYERFYKPEFLGSIAENRIYDRPHNYLIEILSSAGILGAVAYLILIIVAFYGITRLRKGVWKNGAFVLIMLLMAREVQNLMSYDIIPTQLFFYVMLAFIDQAAWPYQSLLDLPQAMRRGSMAVRIISIIIIGILTGRAMWVWNIQQFRAEWSLNAALQALKQVQVEAAIFLMHQAYDKVSPTRRFEMQFVAANHLQGIFGLETSSTETRFRRVQVARELSQVLPELEQYLVRAPDGYQVSAYTLGAKIYGDLFVITRKKEYLDDGLNLIGKALRINAHNPQVYKGAGWLKAVGGELEESLKFFDQAFALYPQGREYLEWKGKAYLLAGTTKADREKGIKFLQAVIRLHPDSALVLGPILQGLLLKQ